MLAVSKDGPTHVPDLPSFSVSADVDFPDFDSIDFDDLFGGDALPYLEMDPADLLADFSDSSADYAVVPSCYKEGEGQPKEGEIESQKPSKERDVKAKKSSSRSESKRKTKVDWTPDLHRRFVQAVEQLGVDKAVPSRILELMGINCLTRHNVASHLQKYRSHRKHLLAREAEAANWTQKRHMYGIAVAQPPAPPPPNCGNNKGNTWNTPTMGFPPPTPPPIHHHAFRPLHVWGHPTHHVEHQSPMPIWPKQPPPHPWAHPPPPPPNPSLWHTHHQRVPNVVDPLTPCFPHPMPTTRFAVGPPVTGIPPTHAAMYRPDQRSVGGPAGPMELHPSKESVDAVIGDVLTKPWLPLPIGLKPPSTDSVMGELQRQGVPAIPTSCS